MKPGASWIPSASDGPTSSKALGHGVLTALYTIVSAAMAFLFVDQFLADRGAVSTSLLLGLLLVFSLAFLWNSARKLLSFLHPMPTVIMPALVHRPGASFYLAWTFPRKARLLNHLTVSLKFNEGTDYLVGSTPVEEQQVRFTYLLYEGEPGLVSGSALVAIPEHAMHSFATVSNSIVWAIHFDGESKWPFVPPMHYEAPVIVGFWT